MKPAANDVPESAPGMLEDPGLSRQWVARRLQRTLGLERWGAPLRNGMARRLPAPLAGLVDRHARAAGERATVLEGLLTRLGSAPYSRGRLARPLAGAAGAVVASLTARGAIATMLRFAEHLLAEYEALVALVDGAPGVPDGTVEKLEPLLEAASGEVGALLRAADPRDTKRPP